jgi:uncharacterized protein (TIGR02996 family)
MHMCKPAGFARGLLCLPFGAITLHRRSECHRQAVKCGRPFAPGWAAGGESPGDNKPSGPARRVTKGCAAAPREPRPAALFNSAPVDHDPALLAAILADPDDEPGWLALAAWVRDNGRNDEACIVRVFWPAIRGAMAQGRTLDWCLEYIRRNDARLGQQARGLEEHVRYDRS